MAYTNFTNLTDWQYDTATKKIKHNTGTARITVNALYSEVMDEFDNSGQMDDTVPMSAQTPTEYTLINGWTFDSDADLGYLYGGSVVVQKATTDRDVWANFYTLGTIEADGVVYWFQNGAAVAAHPGYTAGHIDQLIKVVAAGTNVSTDGTALAVRAYIRNNASANADLYDHFTAVASATGGRNPVPLASAPDTNDDGLGSAVTGVTITFGTTSQDIGDGNGAQNYDVLIDGGANSVSAVYKYLKYWTRRGNTSAVGTGNALQAQFYRGANAAYAEVKAAPFGSFAGGKIYGARGVYITNVSDPSNRALIDAAGTARTPPTLITAAITGVAVGDRVFMARSTGAGSTTVNKSQFTLNGAHASGSSTVVVNQTVGLDIPTTGVIRILETSYAYTALNRGTKTFTITGTLGGSGYSTGAAAYVPLIDTVVAAGTSVASPAIQYVADMDVVYRVRKKGIQPFENTGVVGNTNFAAAAIRTADTIAT